MSKLFINYKEKYLGFRVKPNFTYDISFWQLAEEKDGWVQHLSQKNWFDDETKKDFVKTFDKLKKEKYF